MILGEPIILGGGGGIDCVVIITTDPSAVVTCSLGNTSISKTANADGKAAFELKKAGVWTVTASHNGETVSKEIDTSLSLETELAFADPILENNTWEQISKIARSGKASQVWNVGDTKQITVNGKTYNAQIIGFDHDNVTDSASYGREKAGITFQFGEIYSNEKWANTNPWHGSSLRTTTMANILSKMDDCKNYIVPVNKISMTAYNHASETIVSDSLFLLSEGEIFGTLTYCGITEGSQYAFYAAGNSKLKKFDGTVLTWWTRSGQYGTKSSYASKRVYVSTGGTVSLNDYSYSSGIDPAFCI